MICIFRQESGKREQDGLSPAAIAMITAQRMIQVFFDICWWCGSPECDVRIRMIEICGSHGGADYTDSDLFIPIRHQRCVPFMRMW